MAGATSTGLRSSISPRERRLAKADLGEGPGPGRYLLAEGSGVVDRVASAPDRFGVVALSVVGAAGAVLNLGIVRELALAAGYGEHAAWLYWLLLDFFAVIAMRGAFWARTPKVRWWAGVSSVFALVLSGAAAGLHVFIVQAGLPSGVAFAVLCLPAVMIGLSLHLVLLMSLEGGQEPAEDVAEGIGGQADIEITERHTERVCERRTAAITSAPGSKTARFVERLRTTSIDDSRRVVDLVAELNTGIDLAAPNARKLVAAYRRGELS